MSKKTFIVYSDWIDYTEEMTLEEQGLFYRTIFRYYNGLDIGNIGNIKFIWSKIKKQIDINNAKWEEVLEKRKKAGKLGGLAKAKQNQASASKTKQVLASAKSAKKKLANLADTDTDTVSVSVSVNKKKSNTLTHVKEAKAFGNADVNKCLEIIKKVNGGILDGKIQENRNYANMLIRKIKKTDLVVSGMYTRDIYLSDLLKIVINSKYDVRKISGPKNIFYSLAGLSLVAKTMMTDAVEQKEKEDSSFNPLY